MQVLKIRGERGKLTILSLAYSTLTFQRVFKFTYSQEFKDSFLDLVKTVVVFIKISTGLG